MKTYTGKITKLNSNQIFVFGSNTQGRHGAGSAKVARDKFGAIYGIPEGRQNQAYALVTKDLTKYKHPSISKERIIEQIKILYEYAKEYCFNEYFVAYSGEGTNLNGYTPLEMAEMFGCTEIPDNVVFEEKFYELIKTFFISQ